MYFTNKPALPESVKNLIKNMANLFIDSANHEILALSIQKAAEEYPEIVDHNIIKIIHSEEFKEINESSESFICNSCGLEINEIKIIRCQNRCAICSHCMDEKKCKHCGEIFEEE